MASESKQEEDMRCDDCGRKVKKCKDGLYLCESCMTDITGGHIVWRLKNDGNVHAFNHGGEWLGYLRCEQVGAHRHWCWYQIQGIRMSPGCLQEVRNKQKELFKNRKGWQ